jgi:hypothetical protein
VGHTKNIHTELAVIGGGPAGICAAISAAHLGISTILVGNRPVLGGNSSSEIRVWTRGATGAGNLYAEEMGVWGRLKLENLYRNPDANPVFWDEILLDAVLREKKIELYLNTDAVALSMNEGQITRVTAYQQGTEEVLSICAAYYIDATGDGSIAAKAGIPWYMGEERLTSGDSHPLGDPGIMGNSILYYTRREDHPVRFVPPDYAYSMDEIQRMLDQGGRIINETSSGSDCWWFEYGGTLDTIRDAQTIAVELKRLVLGVWNYIKNSGRFHADCYTLEWLGSLPGKRESRRMEAAYRLRDVDLLENSRFPDGAFYGGWYMDFHPAGGIRDSQKANCIQIPVHVYQIPLRCLYHPSVPNLLFAGRIIGTEREAFVSSRIMNTCALSGQAAGTLASACLSRGRPPAELDGEDIEHIRQTLLREDMFIPGVKAADPLNMTAPARISASSWHTGGAVPSGTWMAISGSAFLVFPGLGGRRLRVKVRADRILSLTGELFSDMLPSRLLRGRSEGRFQWDLFPGETDLELIVPEACEGRFCTLLLADAEGASLALAKGDRTGFLCGRVEEPVYRPPMAAYSPDAGKALYGPAQLCNGYSRPWGGPNQWRAADEDGAPWIRLDWEEPIRAKELRLCFDPDLSAELPSSRTRQWEAGHHFAPRAGMPGQLVKSFRIEALKETGEWIPLRQEGNNYQRMVVIPLPEEQSVVALRIQLDGTWGGESPAVYEIRVIRR